MCIRDRRNGVTVHRWIGQHIFAPYPMLRPWTPMAARRDLRDAERFTELLDEFRPDVVSWWSLYGVAKILLPIPIARGIPDVHWIEHWWMIAEYGRSGEIPAAFWKSVWDGEWGPQPMRPLFRGFGRAWERRVAARGLPTREFPNRPTHVCFVSEYLRDLHREAGISFPSTQIIHGGVPVDAFYAPREPRSATAPLRLLYAGQLSADRGLHTVVEALGALAPESRSRATLSVAGSSASSDYQDRVAKLVSKLGLDGCVTFLGRVPHAEMKRTFSQHDVLVFPSMREEGLPLTMVEAMLAGCAVVTTGSGGAIEVAKAADLPMFPKGDAEALGRLLASLIASPQDVAQLAARCQQVALSEFSLERMMQRWIATLERIVSKAAAT